MNPFVVGISKLGRWSRRIDALNTLLTAKDLPGNGWRFLDEHTWRFSAYPHHGTGEVFDRASAHGGFVAWRSFEQTETHSGLWIQLVPYGRISDAESQVPKNSSIGVRSETFEGSVGEERPVVGYLTPGVDHAVLFEVPTNNEGVAGISRYLCGNVENVVLVVAGTALGDGIPWEQMVSIAALQAERIWEHLGRSK
jgi:hypothetical protein